MFVLGHVGIALGLGLLLDFSLRKRYGGAIAETSAATGASGAVEKRPAAGARPGKMAGLAAFTRRMDYRLLIVGAMLPDIIDKPLGHVFFVDFFGDQGRLFAHSLPFLIVIAVIGLFLYRRWRQQWLLVLSFGTAVHLITDQMWLSPRTSLWPFLGWGFTRDYAGGDWWADLWHSFTQASPYVIATETTGVLLLVLFAIVLLGRKKLWIFIRYGRL